MSEDTEKRAAEVFFAIVHLPADERERHLSTVSDSPPGLIAWIQTLLAAADANRDGFLERPAAGTSFSVSKAAEHNASSSDFPVPLPQSVGPYRVVRLIAERDFTSVYLCRQDEPIRRTAAVKVLHSLQHRRELLQRFEGERQFSASFQHRHIAQFYEAGTTDTGAVFFSMEFVDGQNIVQHCTDRNLSARDRLRLFLQVCDAIEHAHQRGVIHRDLKPANILVQPDDREECGCAKVIDFGVAKALDTDQQPTATVAGQMIGTFAYMSPEQLSGRPETVDTRADVFALGLVLFEMLTGRAARQSLATSSNAAAMDAATHGAWALSLTDNSIPDDLARIIGKATSPCRDARYGTVEAFRQDVERFLTNRPVSARSAGMVYRTRKFIRRNRLATAASVLLAVSAAVTSVVVWRARTQRLDLAVQLAEAWFEETRVMQSTIGEAALRGPALKRLSAQVAAFSQIAPEDPRVRSMQASSLTELGYAAMDANDIDAAERAFQEAYCIRKGLVDDHPTDERAQMQLSLATVRLGDVAGARGDSHTRLAWCLRALQIDERMIERHPTDTHALSNLGWSYDRLGNIAQQQGELEQAAGYKLKAVEVFDRYARLGTHAEALRGRATAHLSLAEVYELMTKIPAAAEHAGYALRDSKAAAEINPSDRFVLQVLVYSEFRHADFSRRANRPGVSVQTALDAVQHAELLLSLAPSDPALRRLLAAALLTASRYALECNHANLALSLAQRAREQTVRSTEHTTTDEHHLHMLEESDRLIHASQQTSLPVENSGASMLQTQSSPSVLSKDAPTPER